MANMKLLASLVVLALAVDTAMAGCSTSIEGIMGSGTCNGDGTFYGAGQDYAGTCQFGKANANSLPWVQNTAGMNAAGMFAGKAMTVSITSMQFDSSYTCGLCIRFRCPGGGSGGTPMPKDGWTHAVVNNQCPECGIGALDIAQTGDGRWKCEWEPLPEGCPVGGSNIRWCWQAGHNNYMKLSAYNTRYPVKRILTKTGGSWEEGKHTIDGFWEFWGSGYTGQVEIQAIDVQGNSVFDVVNYGGGAQCTDSDSAQFGGSGGGAATTRRQARPKPRTPPKKTPAPKKKTPAPSKRCNFYLQRGWQCGGKGGACGRVGCVDRPWSKGCCVAGTKCRRQNSRRWICK